MKKIVFVCTLGLLSASGIFAQSGYGRNEAEKDIEKKYEADRQKGVGAVYERLDQWDANDKAKRANIEPFPNMSMQMQIEYPEKPKNNILIDYYFKNFDCAAIFKSAKESSTTLDRTIMNFKEGNSTMLMTDKKGRKTGMVMEMKNFDWAVKATVNKSSRDLTNGDAHITATEEYQTIEGYRCRKYLFEDQENKMDLWVSKDVGIDYQKYNRAAGSAFLQSKTPALDVYRQAGLDGVTIQTHIFPKSGRGSEAILTVKNIKAGGVSDEMFSTAGYEVTKLPSLKDIWKSANDQ